VENFRLTDYVEGKPLFDWSTRSGQRPFQVAYGPADADPDSYTVLSATARPYLLSARDLDPAVVYAARCRGRCHHTCVVHDTIFWGEWSDTVQFCTGAVGIVPMEENGIAFTLSPNPARDEVTVAVGEGMALPCTVVLRDEAGRELLRRRVNTSPPAARYPSKEGTLLTFSTQGLAAGLYLVTLETPKGSSIQKLVVE
jgi:hypothetical protein